jgi:hypothetical protein
MKTIPTCLLIALLATAASGAVTETISQTHPLAADGTIALSNVNGTISITAWDRNEVAIEAVKKAENAEDLARIQVKIDAQPTRLTVTIEQAARSGAAPEEVLEAIEVGIEMGGGRATVSARFALEVMENVFGPGTNSEAQA